MTQYVPTTEAARALKAALRAEYPDVTFSVRKDRGTACSWIRVEYFDGPTDRAVQRIADMFAGRDYLVDGVLVSRHVGPDGRAAVAARVAAVAPGVTALDPDGALSTATLTPEQATELGVRCANGPITVRDAAWQVFARLDLTAV
ncbi:MAG: hypothetical protein IE923_07970 [Micrococcales bacterium]|nr:hypothetical protein [Micrococcales bacterium]